MRSVGILLVNLLFAFTSFTQDYSVKSLTLDLEGASEDFEIIVKNEVYNLTSDTIHFKWIREEYQVSDGWENAVCNDQECYFETVDSAEFFILPNDTSNFDLYFYPNGNEGFGSATLFLQQLNVGDPGVAIEYNASAQATGLDEFGSTILVDVLPNPFVETIYLRELPVGVVIIELFDELGKLTVSEVTSSSDFQINTEDVQPGSHVLIVRNPSGIFRRRLHKI